MNGFGFLEATRATHQEIEELKEKSSFTLLNKKNNVS